MAGEDFAVFLKDMRQRAEWSIREAALQTGISASRREFQDRQRVPGSSFSGPDPRHLQPYLAYHAASCGRQVRNGAVWRSLKYFLATVPAFHNLYNIECLQTTYHSSCT